MEKNNDKPKLRFPGFTDPWEQRKLSDKVDIIGTGKSKFISNIQKTERKPYAVLGSTSVISYDDEYDYSGEFVLTARVGANAGDLYRHSGNVKISDNTVFLQGKNLDFIFFTLTKFNLKNLAFGTGQPLIKASELSNLDLMLPGQVEEQKQIGDFFNNLDNIITLHQRKLNHLQDKKKSLLQKMFPKNGENFPELRFPEFTDPWEQRKLGEVFNQTTEYVNPQVESIELWSLTVENGLTPKTDRYVRDFLVKKEDKYKAVRPNDIVYNPMNMTLGAIGYNNMSKIVAVSGYYVTMKPTDLIDGYYIKTWMQRPHSINLYKMCATGSLIEKQRVQYPTFAQINFTLPEIEEQKKIGAYFRNIDNLITLHQRKLNHLKEQKKALLQQMFV